MNNLTRTRRLTIIALAASLCTVTNFLLVPIENVKPMDLIVFVTGYIAGPSAGAITGILGWSVYGTMNPNGFNMNVWIATSLGETIYGLAGGFVGRRFRPKIENRTRDAFLFGVLAGILTLIYDVFTTLVAIFTFGFPVTLSFILALPWFVAHEAGNVLIFSSSTIPVLQPLGKIFWRQPS